MRWDRGGRKLCLCVNACMWLLPFLCGCREDCLEEKFMFFFLFYSSFVCDCYYPPCKWLGEWVGGAINFNKTRSLEESFAMSIENVTAETAQLQFKKCILNFCGLQVICLLSLAIVCTLALE